MPDIKQLIKDLTLEEKVELLSGFDAWQTNKIDRLGIPSIKCQMARTVLGRW